MKPKTPMENGLRKIKLKIDFYEKLIYKKVKKYISLPTSILELLLLKESKVREAKFIR